VQRDVPLLGTQEHVRRRYERRYLPGQVLYREASAPLDHADIVVDNSRPATPWLLRQLGEEPRGEGEDVIPFGESF
jgi:uridine kinase